MYIVYKTTNKVTGQYYIGSHKITKDDDDYLGSGVEIINQLNTYSRQFFNREILADNLSSDDAIAIEHELVKRARKDPLCINKSSGGQNFEHINSIPGLNNSANNYQKASDAFMLRMKNDPEFAARHSLRCKQSVTEEDRRKRSLAMKGNKFGLGYKHSPEAKKAIGCITSQCQKGSGNSQYGTFWITNGVTNMKWRTSNGGYS